MIDGEVDEKAKRGWSVARVRGVVLDQCRDLFVAVQFLTRLPTPRVDLDDELERRLILGRSTVYFPVVGAFLGAVTGGTILLAAQVWSIAIAVALGLAFEALLTGAFHEDAVADFCDAFGGGWTREDILRILKDSRVGSFGVLGLGLAVTLRGVALGSIEADRLLSASMASASLGRWAALLAMWALPPIADRPSLSRDVGRQVPIGRLLLGTALALPGCVGLAVVSPWRLAAAVAAILAVTAWLVRYVGRRIGGINGDSLGFLCYVAQVVVLLAAAAGEVG